MMGVNFSYDMSSVHSLGGVHSGHPISNSEIEEALGNSERFINEYFVGKTVG